MVVVSILLGSDTISIPQYLYNRLEWEEYMMICSEHLNRKGVFNMNSDSIAMLRRSSWRCLRCCS